MPFFQAINPALAADHDPNGVDTPASCGPYYIADRIPNNSITIMRNRYYTGPRPHNVSEIDYKIGNTPVVIEQNVQSGTDRLRGDRRPLPRTTRPSRTSTA